MAAFLIREELTIISPYGNGYHVEKLLVLPGSSMVLAYVASKIRQFHSFDSLIQTSISYSVYYYKHLVLVPDLSLGKTHGHTFSNSQNYHKY